MIRSLQTGLVALFLVVSGLQTVAAQKAPVTIPEGATGPTWIPFSDALTAAGRSGKKVLVDVWSGRCGWCARMQREVYPEPELMAYLEKHFETARLDIDVKDDQITYAGYTLSSAELSVGFGATGTPTAVFLMPDGTYITRLPGFHDAETFLGVLRFIGSDSYKTMTFEEYSASKSATGSGR